ncbi:MAG: transporter [Muribaculaceae bacterium]|nr:transporter [Muribaculaceae bacterium]
MGYLTFLSPYLIFLMLFITYCRLSPRQIKPGRFDWYLLAIQIALGALTYALLFWADHTVAEGVFICVFVPTATAAPVITSMLGGDIKKVVTYSLVSNLFVAVTGPVILAAIGDNSSLSFGQSFLLILKEVGPLLIAPMLSAFALQYIWPKMHERVANHQQLSFYIWALSLFIIVGGCVSFAINAWTPSSTWIMLALTVGAGVVCIAQYIIGRRYGRRFDDPVSGAQSLMQKNTVLAVWLALAYMNPIASIGPAAYILWQNIINSWQIARHDSFLIVGR